MKATAIALWPIPPFGFEEQNGGNNAGAGNSGGNPSGATNNPGSQSNPPAGQGQNQDGSQGNSPSNDDDDDDPYAGLSQKDLKRRLREEAEERAKAERERDSAQSNLTAKEREKLDKEQRLELDVQERDKEIATLTATNSRLALVNAILNDSTYQWHNAEIVAQQLDSQKVTVDPKTGIVEGLKKELKRVAEDHDYLLRSQQQNNNDSQQNNNRQQRQPYTGLPTGIQPGQGGANGGGHQNPTVDQLAENYPALASRR